MINVSYCQSMWYFCGENKQREFWNLQNRDSRIRDDDKNLILTKCYDFNIARHYMCNYYLSIIIIITIALSCKNKTAKTVEPV